MSISAFLLDLDGVMYTGGSKVPGAKDTISWLRDEGYLFRFVSNTTRRSRKTISGRLSAMGLDIPPDLILTPAVAAAAELADRGCTKIFLLSTGDVHLDFADAGLELSTEGAEAVVVGDAGDRFTYAAMNTAFRLMLDGVPALALEKDHYWMDTDGLSLSAGPFVAALEYATGVEAKLVGKPSKAFFRMALDSMDRPPSGCAMVGDDAISDVQGAMDAGMAGILVRTGKYRQDAVERMSRPPTAILHSIADLPQYLKGSSKE